MKVARIISLLIGYGLILIYVVWTWFLWAGIYGGIGLFGAIFTTPISVVLMYISNLFSSINGFIATSVYTGLVILFITLGGDD